MGKVIILFLTIIVIFCDVNGQFFRNYCVNDLISQVVITNLRYTTYVQYNQNTSEIELYANFTWKVISPPEQNLDGFVFHMLQNSDDEFLGKSKLPINVCNPGNYFWSTTDNPLCTNNISLCDGPVGSISAQLNHRLCPSNFSSEGERCQGTGNFYLQNLKYISIPSNVRSLVFRIDYHQSYELTLVAYYREFVSIESSLTIQHISDCPATLSHSTGLSLSESEDLCCDQNVPHYIARNVSFRNPVISDLNLGTINASLTWLPPINDFNLQRFTFFIRKASKGPTPQFSVQNITEVLLNEEERKLLSNCDKTIKYYSVTISDLKPKLQYQILINAIYKSNSTSDFPLFEERPGCFDNRCDIFVDIKTPAVNACDPKYNALCDDRGHCSPFDESGLTSLKVTCSCPEGYEGNGLNASKHFLGSGCTEKSYCTPKLNPCGADATCVDRPAPAKGADCVCNKDYFSIGRNCVSIYIVVLGVCVPALALLALFFAIIACHYFRRLKRSTRAPTVVNCKKEVLHSNSTPTNRVNVLPK